MQLLHAIESKNRKCVILEITNLYDGLFNINTLSGIYVARILVERGVSGVGGGGHIAAKVKYRNFFM